MVQRQRVLDQPCLLHRSSAVKESILAFVSRGFEKYTKAKFSMLASTKSHTLHTPDRISLFGLVGGLAGRYYHIPTRGLIHNPIPGASVRTSVGLPLLCTKAHHETVSLSITQQLLASYRRGQGPGGYPVMLPNDQWLL